MMKRTRVTWSEVPLAAGTNDPLDELAKKHSISRGEAAVQLADSAPFVTAVLHEGWAVARQWLGMAGCVALLYWIASSPWSAVVARRYVPAFRPLVAADMTPEEEKLLQRYSTKNLMEGEQIEARALSAPAQFQCAKVMTLPIRPLQPEFYAVLPKQVSLVLSHRVTATDPVTAEATLLAVLTPNTAPYATLCLEVETAKTIAKVLSQSDVSLVFNRP